MSSSYGENLHLTIFGQSHSPAIGVTMEGIPAGENVDPEALQRFLSRRAPGQNAWSTPRKEGDVPEFLCGLKDGRTCGAPITAIIRNTNADAILAVYPFTGEPVITQALLTAAQAPLFVGVGGGTTTGQRVIQLAMMAEMQGAAGVVLNAPAPPSTVYDVARITNTPVIATVLTCDDELDEKIEAGASIINVAAGRRTPDVVQQIRQRHPSIPLLASGG